MFSRRNQSSPFSSRLSTIGLAALLVSTTSVTSLSQEKAGIAHPLSSAQVDLAEILGEPRFTAGTFNTVFFVPDSDAYMHEVCYFDTIDGDIHGCIAIEESQSRAATDTLSVTFESLENGQTYGYFVVAYCPDPVPSVDTTYSTQDATPPVDSVSAQAQAAPDGVVIVGWSGVDDNVSYVDLYEVRRKQWGASFEIIDTVVAEFDNGPATDYEYRDSLGGTTGLAEGLEYFYTIRAIDAVGNGIGGVETDGMIPDSTLPCIPELTILGADATGDSTYAQGVTANVVGKSNCSDWAHADSIMFQAVRDSIRFFEDEWMPGWSFFDTGWVAYEPDSFLWRADLLPENNDTDYVDLHRYYFRARTKDNAGNLSSWSEPIDAIMDAYPPSDISNLEVYPKADSAGTAAVMVVDWDPATDAGSGVGRYYVYRKTVTGTYAPMGSTDAGVTYYEDSCHDVVSRTTVCYRIGSRDNVGNVADYAESVWEACGKPALPPIVTVDCDIIVESFCFSVRSSITVLWTGYDNTYVAQYLIDLNGAQFVQSDPAQSQYNLPLGDDGYYQVKVQAVFDDGTKSPWSVPDSFVKDQSAPGPVVDLVAVNDTSGPTGDIDLWWSAPSDASGVAKYLILRRLANAGDFEIIDTTFTDGSYPNFGAAYTDLYADPYYDTLVTYQFYVYQVQAVDYLGNRRTNANSIDSAYCNRPPAIDTGYADPDLVHIHWQRATPSLASYWRNIVRIYRNSFDTLIVEDTLVGSDSLPYMPGVDSANYIFQVKEVPLNPELDSLCTSWSQAYTVPYNNLPPPPDSLALQPQPILAWDTALARARIYLSWFHERPLLVDSFSVTRSTGAGDSETFTVVSEGSSFYGYMDSALWADTEYTYGVVAYDTLGQLSDTVWGSASVNPMWMFTPRMIPREPVYFNSDTLTVSWEWLDEDMHPLPFTTLGADSCLVELSISATFNALYPHIETWLPAAGRTGDIVGIRDLIDAVNKTIYCRALARDRFGNPSYWSTDYFDTVKAVVDDLPPAPVQSLVIDSTRADLSAAEELISVFLSWDSVSDRGGSGMAFYTIARSSSGGGWDTVGTVSGTAFEDQGVDVRGADNCHFNYRIQPVDQVGNEQIVGNNEVCLGVIEPPVLDDPDSIQVITWRVPYSVSVDQFYAECAHNPMWLGTNFIDSLDMPRAWIDGDSVTLRFDMSPAFVANADTVYYHIKAIRDSLESGWSAVVSFYNDPSTDVDTDDKADYPLTFRLHGNYPNPFNPQTRISFELPTRSTVLLKVFNVNGELVATLIDETLHAGHHTVTWTGSDRHGRPAASGVYFYQLKTSNGCISRKMILLR